MQDYVKRLPLIINMQAFAAGPFLGTFAISFRKLSQLAFWLLCIAGVYGAAQVQSHMP